MRPAKPHIFTAAALTLLVAAPVLAQGVPIFHRGVLDVGGFGLSAFGSSLGGVSVSGSSLAFGTSAFTVGAPTSNGGGGFRSAWAATRRIRLYGEWSYIGGSAAAFNENHIVQGAPPTNQQVTLNAQTSFSNFTGGLEYLFPLTRWPKIVPYVQAGAGALRIGGGASVSTIGGTPAPGQVFSNRILDFRGIGTGGAGVRYYFTDRAGLRFELDAVFGPQSGSAGAGASEAVVPNGTTHAGRFVYGFFYEIH